MNDVINHRSHCRETALTSMIRTLHRMITATIVAPWPHRAQPYDQHAENVQKSIDAFAGAVREYADASAAFLLDCNAAQVPERLTKAQDALRPYLSSRDGTPPPAQMLLITAQRINDTKGHERIVVPAILVRYVAQHFAQPDLMRLPSKER